MSDVRRNTVANYLGQGWSALMSLVFVPIYISYIGIEAYGVIGFFAALQSLFTILDFGMSAVLNRELARRSAAGGAGETRDLVRTLECLYWPLGLLIAGAVWLLAGPVSQHWISPVALSPQDAERALVLLGLAAALQWPVSFYTGGLSGLQRQVLLNSLASGFATLRGLGAVGVLALVSPTLEAYLWWQVGVSGVQSTVFAVATWRCLPRSGQRAVFSTAQLRSIGGFALGVTGVTILSFLLSQSDRIVLSKVLPLDAFGVYAFAATAAMALLRLAYPIVSAVYPRYSQMVAAGNEEALTAFYHRSNQMMAAVVLPVAAVLIVFAQDILLLWTRDMALASAAAPILALLTAGAALNGLMNLPYSLQLAHGWTQLSLRVNVVAVCVSVPAIWWFGSRYGGVGAAWVWLALHIGYLVIGIPLMHAKFLPQEMWRWYLQDVLPAFAASVGAALLWRLAAPEIERGVSGFAILLAIAATTAAAAVAASRFPRSVVLGWWATWRAPRVSHE